MSKDRDKCQFGDFQTPDDLALSIASLLREKYQVRPRTIIEPSCGKGAFIRASLQVFSDAKVLAADINPDYAQQAKHSIFSYANAEAVDINVSNFFETDWASTISAQMGHVLIIGNPPWITSSELSLLNSRNAPIKSNFQNHRGIEAITGSSNFDISEWMLLQYIEWLSSKDGTVATLCKYSVARKVLKRIEQIPSLTRKFASYIHLVDAQAHFNASVESCLFILCNESSVPECAVYNSLRDDQPSHFIGIRQGTVVNDIETYERLKHLEGKDIKYTWRSGIKHDCTKVMELSRVGDCFQNGFKSAHSLESAYLYPLLKSSDVSKGRTHTYRKMAIVTQKNVGADTSIIATEAPKTWNYLMKHRGYLEKRKSSVYKGKPPYSIFGVGSYTFKPWKIAISGLYKTLSFQMVGPLEGKPVVFDDTVNFLSFETEAEAVFIYSILTSELALNFLNSIVFWDDKRPITIRVLKRLSLKAAAKELNVLDQYLRWATAI